MQKPADPQTTVLRVDGGDHYYEGVVVENGRVVSPGRRVYHRDVEAQHRHAELMDALRRIERLLEKIANAG